MEAYRPIIYVVSLFVAWWAQALLSNPLPPALPFYLILLASSGWLAGGAAVLFKERSRPSALFTLGCALLPHLYYLEMFFLSASPNFMAERLIAVYTVYNLFRYLFLALTFLVIIRRLIQKLSSFADENPLPHRRR